MHATLVVIGDNVEEQMAPHQEDEHFEGLWDWYEIGGRWEGYFTRTDGKTCDIVRVCDIDLDNLRIPHGFLYEGDVYLSDDEVGYIELYTTLLKRLPNNTRLTLVDYHY